MAALCTGLTSTHCPFNYVVNYNSNLLEFCICCIVGPSSQQKGPYPSLTNTRFAPGDEEGPLPPPKFHTKF